MKTCSRLFRSCATALMPQRGLLFSAGRARSSIPCRGVEIVAGLFGLTIRRALSLAAGLHFKIAQMIAMMREKREREIVGLYQNTAKATVERIGCIFFVFEFKIQ